MMILPGFYKDLSNEDYHADPAIGSSGIRQFMELPALYYAYYLDPVGRAKKAEEFSKAQRFGSHAHIALLEPELFEQKFVISPEFAVVNKGKKNPETKPMNRTHGDWTAFENEAKAQGKEAILHSEMEKLTLMAAQIKNDPLAYACTTGKGINEASFFCPDEQSGVMIKSRPDRVVDLQGLGGYRFCIVDYKTTALSLSDHTQSNYAFNSGRHIQAYMHRYPIEKIMDTKIDAVIYLTQSTEYPYLVRVFELEEEDIAMGEEDVRNAMDGWTDHNGIYHKGLAECMKDNVWPSYHSVITKYTRPAWMNYKQ